MTRLALAVVLAPVEPLGYGQGKEPSEADAESVQSNGRCNRVSLPGATASMPTALPAGIRIIQPARAHDVYGAKPGLPSHRFRADHA